MTTFRDLLTALRELEINPSSPVIAHASLSSFGKVNGGAETMIGALLACFQTLIMPAFTYKTMLIPEAGPSGNASAYGGGKDTNRMAEFYHPDLPVDTLIGAVPDALRLHPKAKRSMHPILSFAGVNAGSALDAQVITEPLAPIRILAARGGWALLLGVDHTVNTSIHYAERCAGRKGFIRWALTPKGVVECPGFPGCSDGFEALTPRLEGVTRLSWAGPGLIQAIPLVDLVDIVKMLIRADPAALLCERKDCERCDAVRAASGFKQ